MKIIHTTNYFMPELGYQEYYLAKYHAEMGNEVHVITSDRAYPKQSDYAVFDDIFPNRHVDPGVYTVENFTVHRLPSSFEYNMQLFLRGLLNKISSISPDIVYMHGFTRYETLRVALWKKIFRKSFILVVDDHMQLSAYVERGYRNIYYKILNFIIRKFGLFKVMDKVVAISAETKQYLQAFFSIPDEKISIINLGVDREMFVYSPLEKIVKRAELKIPEEAFLIIYAGKIIPSKKCDLVYEISKEYLKKDPKVFLLFIGSGGDSNFAQEIKQKAEIDGVGHKIIWHPHIPHQDLPKYFSAANVAIWPFQETMAALEAAACSLPIILRDSLIAQEYISNGNGFACSSLEEQKIALGQLISDPCLQHDLGEKGVDLIEMKYDWKKVAKLFLQISK